jgi:ribosomal protein L39E
MHRCVVRVSLNLIRRSQGSNKTFIIKRKLGKKLKQNRPMPNWIRQRTDNTVRWVSSSYFVCNDPHYFLAIVFLAPSALLKRLLRLFWIASALDIDLLLSVLFAFVPCYNVSNGVQ